MRVDISSFLRLLVDEISDDFFYEVGEDFCRVLVALECRKCTSVGVVTELEDRGTEFAVSQTDNLGVYFGNLVDVP